VQAAATPRRSMESLGLKATMTEASRAALLLLDTPGRVEMFRRRSPKIAVSDSQQETLELLRHDSGQRPEGRGLSTQQPILSLRGRHGKYPGTSKCHQHPTHFIGRRERDDGQPRI